MMGKQRLGLVFEPRLPSPGSMVSYGMRAGGGSCMTLPLGKSFASVLMNVNVLPLLLMKLWGNKSVLYLLI